VNSLAVSCAIEAIQDQDYIQNYVNEILEARETLCNGLGELGLSYFPSQANFVLVRFGGRTKKVCEGLRERGLLVRDRSRDIPGTVRITVGTKRQMRKMLKLLAEVMAK
jgi:histidinol-phosphate aminotransferase